jgi:hypothetical protein
MKARKFSTRVCIFIILRRVLGEESEVGVSAIFGAWKSVVRRWAIPESGPMHAMGKHFGG